MFPFAEGAESWNYIQPDAGGELEQSRRRREMDKERCEKEMLMSRKI